MKAERDTCVTRKERIRGLNKAIAELGQRYENAKAKRDAEDVDYDRFMRLNNEVCNLSVNLSTKRFKRQQLRHGQPTLGHAIGGGNTVMSGSEFRPSNTQ